MNNYSDTNKVFTAKEAKLIANVAKIISASIVLHAFLFNSGVAYICIFVIALPLTIMAFSINTHKSQEKQSSFDKKLASKKKALEEALNKTPYKNYTQQPASNYLFSKPTLYLIAFLIAVFGICQMADGDLQSTSFFIVAVALANHAHQR
jgi:anaerobic C4-dicarboxylate transporter